MLHYILTRFNLRLYHVDKVGDACRTDKWLEDRFARFEKYCFPSVAGQSCKNFKWIVLFDEGTPEVWVKKFWDYRKQCPQFQPLMVKKTYSPQFDLVFQTFITKDIQEYIKNNGVESVKCVTTWLDNDDAINKDYVAVIQQWVNEYGSDNDVLYFERGAQYVESLGLAVVYDNNKNHFCSLVEDYTIGYNLKTVFFSGDHVFLYKYDFLNIKSIKDKRMLWLEVVHDHNVINDTHPTKMLRLITDKDVLCQYSLNIKLNESLLSTYIFRFIPRLIIKAYQLINMEIRKLIK